MPRIDLSTAGVTVQYAIETSAGTRPTTGYTPLTGITAIPDLNPEPGSLETTTLDETDWRTYIPGLKDPGGALAFSANNTEQFQTDWATMVEEAEEGRGLDVAIRVGMDAHVIHNGVDVGVEQGVDRKGRGLDLRV